MNIFSDTQFNDQTTFAFHNRLPLTHPPTIEINQTGKLTPLQLKALGHGRINCWRQTRNHLGFFIILTAFLWLTIGDYRPIIQAIIVLVFIGPLLLLLRGAIDYLRRWYQTPTKPNSRPLATAEGEITYHPYRGLQININGRRYYPLPAMTDLLPGRYRFTILTYGRWLINATPLDSDETRYNQYQKVLEKLFNFTNEDLQTHQLRQISFKQKLKLIFTRPRFVLEPLLLTVPFLTYFQPWLGLSLLAAILSYIIYKYYLLHRHAYQILTGTLTKYRSGLRHANERRRHNLLYAQIDDITIPLTPHQYHCLQPHLTYQVHFHPVSNQILSLKIIHQ
ncbi:MAG TPA: hypothetical protein VLL52_10130 [Anaerolineae bacterium]|nr:hypothetical protein [Anaerolineae bacterium]